MAKTTRSYDKDGRLHVYPCRLTKANVCEYFGYEIPQYKDLKLDPDKLYRLYRDADELKKAIDTFNNVPVLNTHVKSSAEDHHPDNIVGSTGTDAEFKAPYVLNSLVVWSKAEIDAIESEEAREISASYYYRADMKSGKIDGEPYDGVMRDIHCNHVALVPEGRAGSDVLVGDSKPMKIKEKRGELTGAFNALIRPKVKEGLAFDAAPALAKIKSASARKLAELIYGIAQPSLAEDAELDIKDVVDVIKAVQDPSADPVAEDEDDHDDDDGDDDVVAEDEDDDSAEKLKKVLEYIKDNMSERDNEAIETLLSDLNRGDDEEPEDKKDDDKDDKDEVAMDAKAVDRRVSQAVARVRREAHNLRIAEKEVFPVSGDLALDSAEAVYRHGLRKLGVDVSKLPASAYPETFRAVLKARRASESMANDSRTYASSEDFEKRYPNRLRRF